MDTILGFLSYLLLELPARALAAFPESPLPLIVILIVGALVILSMINGRRKRRRHKH